MNKILNRLAQSLLLLSTILTTAKVNALATPMIIGGTDVAANDPIAQTTVLIIGKYLRSSFTCTGSIVGPDLILTAGHCLGPYAAAEIKVLFRTRKDGPGPEIKALRQMRAYDETPTQSKDWNDIALIRLASPIPAGYHPAKLITDTSALIAGAPIILAGYGVNTLDSSGGGDFGLGVLRKVDQVIIDPHYGHTEVLVDIHNKGSCRGDSGGPAFVQINDELLLWGAASRMTENDAIPGSGNGHGGGKDYACTVDLVYTNILAQAEWLRQAAIELHKPK